MEARLQLYRQWAPFVFAGAVLALMVVLLSGSAAFAYAPNRSGAQQFAADFCAGNPVGAADYVWLSAPDNENNTSITVVKPANTVTVRVNVYVQYCSAYPGGGAGSNYWSDIGGINGNFNYGNTSAYATWYDYQLKGLDVSGWDTGDYRICMTLTTWTESSILKPQPTPSACSTLHLTVIYPWFTDGSSFVGINHSPNVHQWDALPGDTATWSHGIWNTTDYLTDSIRVNVNRSGFSAASGLNGNTAPRFNEILDSYESFWFGSTTGNYDNPGNFRYVISQDDVGAGFTKAMICQSATRNPGNYRGDVQTSAPACVRVPYRFNLTPTVNAPTDTTEPGAPIGPINPTVTNSGPTKSYDNTSWQLSKFIVGPGGAIPAGADSSSDPCGYYKNGCVKLSNGSQTFMPGDTTVGSIASYTVDDAVMGSRLCFALSVNGYTDSQPPSPSRWRHGVPSCVMIGKKPKIQVWGSDVAARGGINVSLTQKTIGVFGSWVEYGAFSVGSNGRFASGAGLTPQPTPKGSPVQNDWSKLTFANVDASGSPRFGQYSGSASFRPQPNVAQYFNAVSNTSPFKGNKPGAVPNTFKTGDAIQVMTAGDLTLQGDTIPAGRSGVIIASGTVTITGDITYDPKPRTDLNGLSQLVIIAKNINITSGVSNVDAWLVTSDMHNGVVDTCSDHTPPLTGNVCNTALTIHGPVVAGELHLKRTGGSGTGPVDSATPAEVIDLRPDAYLWAQLIAGGAGKAETVYTTELPPRF